MLKIPCNHCGHMMNIDNEAIAKELGRAGIKATQKSHPNHFSNMGKASAKARKRRKEAHGQA